MSRTSEAERPQTAQKQAQRRRIIQQLDVHFSSGCRLVVLQAQAGQGKTTAATQYFSHFGLSPIWYSLSPADRDPLFFLAGFYRSCRRCLDNFRLPLLEDMLEKGAISAAKYPRAARLLLRGMAEEGGERYYIVIDDLHLLDAGGASAQLLRRLIFLSFDGISFLILSRQAVLPALGLSADDLSIGLLRNQDLAFTAAETGDLFSDVLQLPVATSDVSRLVQATEG